MKLILRQETIDSKRPFFGSIERGKEKLYLFWLTVRFSDDEVEYLRDPTSYCSIYLVDTGSYVEYGLDEYKNEKYRQATGRHPRWSSLAHRMQLYELLKNGETIVTVSWNVLDIEEEIERTVEHAKRAAEKLRKDVQQYQDKKNNRGRTVNSTFELDL